MALNQVYDDAESLSLPVEAGVESGDPVLVGDIPGVALTDRDADGNATVRLAGAFELEVKGVGTSGNSAIDVGAILHMQSNGDINKKTDSGKRFGYALGAVGSGGAETILVKVGY